jgi:DNA mismatch endonuclease, patch repair protein
MSERPAASSDAVARRMRNTAQRDTPAELGLRRELHRRGYRYRVDVLVAGVTRGRPDLVFSRERVAVFVDGCFWHCCPDHSTVPTANRDWWVDKLRANVERDGRHTQDLTEAGWLVLRFWEHEDPIRAADEVEAALIRGRSEE